MEDRKQPVHKTPNVYIAGGLAGITEVVFTHPIDVIKTHMQNKNTTKFTFQTLTKGLGFRLLGIVPMRFTFWLTQDITQNIYTIQNKYVKTVCCGLTAGFLQTFIDHPMEMVRINTLYSQNNSFVTAKQLLQNRQLFNGFGYTMCRNLAFGGTYLTVRQLLNIDNVFTTSAIAGLTASILTQPFDYFKTQRQSLTFVHNKAILTEIKELLRTNPKIMWTGGMMRAMICFINMGIGYTFYEYFKDINFIDGTI